MKNFGIYPLLSSLKTFLIILIEKQVDIRNQVGKQRHTGGSLTQYNDARIKGIERLHVLGRCALQNAAMDIGWVYICE